VIPAENGQFVQFEAVWVNNSRSSQYQAAAANAPIHTTLGAQDQRSHKLSAAPAPNNPMTAPYSARYRGPGKRPRLTNNCQSWIDRYSRSQPVNEKNRRPSTSTINKKERPGCLFLVII